MTTDDKGAALSPDELRQLLDRLGLSQAGFARLVGIDRGTPNHWLSGAVAVPRWAALYLRALADLRALCSTLPPSLPPRLQGILPAEKLSSPDGLRENGIEISQHASTMRGMVSPHSMTVEAFKAQIAALGWSQAAFARSVGYTASTVSRWVNEKEPIPAWVPVVLGTLLEIRRLHQTYVQPEGGKADSGP